MWLKIKLYILSLAFLFILIAVNQVPVCYGGNCHFIGFVDLFWNNPPILLFCLVGFILTVMFFFDFKYRIVKGATLPAEKILEIESLNFETLTFLATYIIPLVCFDLDFHLTEKRNFVMLLLVLALIGWIYVKTNTFYTNPTLAILNFKIYKISTADRKNIIVISKDKLEHGDMMLPNKMDDKIFYASKYETE
jgi:hypothetical protein